MEKENNYWMGILGGILGGFLATIPWVLMYVYGGMILEILSVIIAFGALKGYQMFHGKIDSKLPVIVSVISFLAITFATFLAIPALLMVKEGVRVSSATFSLLFNNQEFFGALVADYVISLLFTFLGVGGVVANIKKQLEDGEEYIKAGFGNGMNNNINQENIEMFREAFTKLDALSKDNAVDKEMILDEIEDPNAKRIFNNLRTQQIIAKYKGKYYFKEKYANSVFKRFIKLFVLLFGGVILFTVLIILLFLY